MVFVRRGAEATLERVLDAGVFDTFKGGDGRRGVATGAVIAGRRGRAAGAEGAGAAGEGAAAEAAGAVGRVGKVRRGLVAVAVTGRIAI